MKRIKTITEKILEELNSDENEFKKVYRNGIDSLKFEEFNEEKNINIYEVKFIKEVYNEYLDISIEIYRITDNNKRFIDYVARRISKNDFGYKYYSDFYKVKKKNQTIVWEFGGDKFYEE